MARLLLLPEDGVPRTLRHDLLELRPLALVEGRVDLRDLLVLDVSKRLGQEFDAVAALGA
jgi:hypothetical protein